MYGNDLELVKRHFDAEAPTWSAKYRKGSIFSQRLIHLLRMFDEEGLSEGSVVLDVGCGSGVVLSHILERGHTVYGVDISSRMIRLANSYVRRMRFAVDRARFSLVEGSKLAFRDGVFDAVICCGVLEYVRDDESLVSEISRVLKTNGFAILSVPNSLSILRAAERFAFENVAILEKLPRLSSLVKRLSYLNMQQRQYRRSQFVALLDQYGLVELSAQFIHIPGSSFRMLDRLSRFPVLGMTYLTKVGKLSQPPASVTEGCAVLAGRCRS